MEGILGLTTCPTVSHPAQSAAGARLRSLERLEFLMIEPNLRASKRASYWQDRVHRTVSTVQHCLHALGELCDHHAAILARDIRFTRFRRDRQGSTVSPALTINSWIIVQREVAERTDSSQRFPVLITPHHGLIAVNVVPRLESRKISGPR